MAEKRENAAAGSAAGKMDVRHLGRGSQVIIYLGKLLRMFVYQNDWKTIPMAALIAGLVGMVVRRRMFITMEGTMMGSFALVCVCIWNGCFNSIQVICRERDVIKREHRSGMHISSYILAHMIYQALICALQTAVTLYVTGLTGVAYPEEGLFTRWMIVDIGITMMLITYASDMLSLWVSSLARTSTTAMTIMPFVLIFQLVFSGAMLTIPEWAEPLTRFTISNPGIKAISAQADVNNRPFVTISNMIGKMRGSEIDVTIRLEQALGLMERADNEEIRSLIGELRKDPQVQAHLDESTSFHTTVGEVLDIAGEDAVKTYLEDNAAAASYEPAYENTRENIAGYWRRLFLFAVVFALFSMITLEFIDKDKR